MKKKISLLATFIFIFSMFLFPVSANADVLDEPRFDVVGNASRSSIKPGESTTITIGLRDIIGFQTGINAYSATLEYDNSIFESVTQSDFESLGKWINFEYNPSNHKLIAYTRSRVLNSSDILNLKLKVKKDANSTTTKVKIKELTVSEGIADVVNDFETEIRIIEDNQQSADTEDTEKPGDTEKPDNSKDPEGTNEPERSEDSKNPIDNNQPSPQAIPTGTNSQASRIQRPQRGNVGNPVNNSENTKIYTYLEGAKQELFIDGKTGARFRIDADYSLFEDEGKVYVDDALVDKTNYDSWSGSTVVELKSSYIKTLSIGEHKLSILLSDNIKVDTTFFIRDSSQPERTKPKISIADEINQENINNKLFWITIIILIIAILLLLILKKHNDKKRSINRLLSFVLVVFISALSMIISTSIYTFALTAKGEVNGDDVINEEDIDLIKKHIVELAKIDDNYLKNADMNEDDKITVTDLSLVVTEVENNIDYTVSINDVKIKDNSIYSEKNKDITLNINATTLYDSEITSITIDGTEYKATFENGIYQVVISGYSDAGKKTIELESAILDNGRTVELNYSTEIEVMKDLPTIMDYDYSEKEDDQVIEISFTVNDPDESFESGTYKIRDKNNIVAKSGSVSKGQNTISFSPNDADKYEIEIIVQGKKYLNATETEEVKLSREFTYNIDYKAQITNVKIFNSNDLVNSINTATLDDTLVLGFDFENVLNVGIAGLSFNGNSYSINENDGVYGNVKIELPSGLLSLGENKIRISDVRLINGTILDIEKEATINILPREPQVNELSASENENTLTVNVYYKDEDNASSENIIKVLDESGNVLFERKVNANADRTLDFDITNVITSTFFVEAYSTYNNNTQLIKTVEIIANPRVKVLSGTTQNKLIGKNETEEITYKIVASSNDIRTLIIDNNEVSVNVDNSDPEASINGYTVTAIANGVNQSGLHNYRLQSILIGDTYVNAQHDTPIYIKKSKPTVSINEISDTEDGEVTFAFSIDDADKSFVGGNMSLYPSSDVDFSGEPLYTSSINNASIGELSFNLSDEGEYLYRLEVEYELDPRDESQRTDVSTHGFERVTGSYTYTDNNKIEITKAEFKDSTNQKIENSEKSIKNRLYMEFDTNNNLSGSKAVINGKQYELIESGIGFYAEISEESHGIKEYEITNIILSDLRNISLQSPEEVSFEILKDEPDITGLFIDSRKTNIMVDFNVVDSDASIISGGFVEILDSGENSIAKENIENIGANSFDFVVSGNGTYKVVVTIKYARDEQGVITGEITKEENYMLDLKSSVVELKDVYNVTVYKSTENGLVEYDQLDKNDLPEDKSDLYLRIDMKSLPTYYAGIEELNVRDNKIYATLDETEFLQYRLEGSQYAKKEDVEFEISYAENGTIQGGIGRAEDFFGSINNMSGTYELTRDLDATNIKSNLPIINDVFRGKIDGKGFTIYNLNTALFKELNGATITNINFENSKINGNANVRGLIASKASNTRISNINVNKLKFSTAAGESGGLIGTFTTNSVISNVFMKNVIFTGNNNRTGGMVGGSSGNITIEKSIIEGQINANTSEVGGILGWAQNSVLSGVIFKGEIISVEENRVGGIVGYGSGSTQIDFSLSIANGRNAYAVYGDNIQLSGNKPSGGMYVTENTQLNHHDIDTIEVLPMDIDTIQFMVEWFFGFKSDDVARITQIIQGEIEDVEENKEIPNGDILSKLSGYKEENEGIYYNMYKLMPFADSKIWIDAANTVTNSNIKNKKISNVIPFNGDEQIVGLDKTQINDITRIKIVFDDGAVDAYNVSPINTAERVIAEYTIEGLNIKYQYPLYLNSLDSGLINELTAALSGYDYDNDLKLYADETRLYKDNYNNQIAPKLKEFVTKYISSQTKYPTYLTDSTISNTIRKELISDSYLKKLMSAYIYYHKWYNISMGTSNVSDTVFFNSYMNYDSTIEEMVENVMNGNKDASATNSFYDNVIKDYTGKTLIKYLETLIKIYCANPNIDPNDWFKEQFDGVLIETEADSAMYQLKYRIWDNLSKTRQNLILPLLSAPETNETYLVSIPTTIIIGSLNKYMADPSNQASVDSFKASAKAYSENFARVYGTSSNILPNGERLVNEGYTQMHFETRLGFHAQSKYPGTQSVYTTEDPTLKWIFSPINIEVAQNGAQAYGQGGDVLWEITSAIGQVYVATHESSHTQYRTYWYNGYGGRPGTGFEANADGALSQQVGDGGLVFNLYADYNRDDSDITNNYSYRRIDTADKAKDFYENLFDSSYVLDYLAAQAFLKLTPEQKARVAVVAVEEKSGNTMTTTYKRLTVDQISGMKLENINDLIDNKIMVRNTGTVSKANDGTYGTESLWVFNWYQPHNDNGSPDDNTFKKLGWEMFGYGGIEGFYTYRSGKSKTDLDAICQITGDDDMTWDEYKKMRFNEVANNLNNFNYVDKEEIIDQFYEAFLDDSRTGEYNKSSNVKRIYHQIIKKKTNDYQDGKAYGDAVAINSAEELIEKIKNDRYGIFSLEENLDFSSVSVDTGTNYYIDKFVGTIIGNGHKIEGLRYPLFNEAKFVTISNVNIDGSLFTNETKAIVSLKATNVILHKVEVSNINFAVPLSRETSGSYMEFGCDVISSDIVEITSVDDLLAISTTEYGLQKSYVLTQDITLTPELLSGRNYVIPGTFSGTFNGDGYSIIGLPITLFEKTERATIENLTLESPVVRGQAVLVKEITMESSVSMINVINPQFAASSDRSGIIAGTMNGKSKIQMINISNFVITEARARIGGVVGEIGGNCTISDCYVEGKFSGTGESTGGIVGYGNGDSMVRDSIVKITMENTRATTGGVLGEIYWADAGHTCYVRNVLSLADAAEGSEGDVGNVIVNSRNNQWKDLRGSSGNNYALSTSKLQPYTKATTAIAPNDINENFFKNGLNLREDIWYLDSKDYRNLPRLKFIGDAPALLSLEDEPIEIASAKELLDNIADDPYGIYDIVENLDFDDIIVDENSYIDSFRGVINGNGHTIGLLKKPLINDATGAFIDDVKIIGAEIETDSDVAGALINSGTDVVLTNIVASDIKIKGSGILGGLAGSLNDSYLSCVSVNDIEVRSNGIKPVGGLVGVIGQGTVLDNIYVSGKILLENIGEDGSAVGGVIGKDNGSTISHAIVNVNIISNSAYLDSEVYGVVEGPSEGDEDLEDPQPQDVSEDNDNTSEDSSNGNDSSDESGANSVNGDGLDESVNDNLTETGEDSKKETNDEDDFEELEEEIENEEHTIRVYRTRWNVGKLIGSIYGESYISNSVIYGVASGDAIIGKGQATEINEVYQYKDLTVADIMNKELFESLGFEKDIWNFDNLGLGGPGLLSAEDNVSIIPIGVENINGQTSIQEALVSFACQFVGNPYVYGGTSLTNGADCSGFIMTVYNHFGVAGLPHSSADLRNVGSEVSVSEIQPGDILCFSGHVGIAMGDGYMVHASNERDGIKISTLENYSIITIRRVL